METAPPARAAFLESSPDYAALLTSLATQHGWDGRSYPTYPGLLEAVEAAGSQVVVLNHADLPAGALLERLARSIDGPLVVLTDGDDASKAALRAGATLTIKKPFDLQLLSLAIDALAARGLALRLALAERARVGDLAIRLANHTVERHGRRQSLGPAEWQLFSFLITHPERTFSRAELAEGAWGPGYRSRLSEVELYVSRLRRKLALEPRKPTAIVTVRGQGYRLRLAPDAAAAIALGAPGAPAPDATAVEYMMGAYRALNDVRVRLVSHIRETRDGASASTREQIAHVDLPAMEADLARDRTRLVFWEAWTA